MELHAPARSTGSSLPPRKPKRRKSIILRLLGFGFTAGMFLFVAGSAVAAYYLWNISRDLPTFEKLESYEPRVMTRIHAGDGELISEFATEKRIFMPISAIPEKVRNAFVAAEDKHFYEHGGLDFQGLARAMRMNLTNKITGKKRKLIGASTITQQVAKNFLLSSEQSFERKVKEAILSIRIERTFQKSRILELYLNEIYLGKGAYGVAAAALTYFGKELSELTTEEIAYLALLPKAPNNYDPVKHHDAAMDRRNYVINRMAEDNYITPQEAKAALAKPLAISPRGANSHVADDYFTEDTRRALLDMFGEEKLYTAGYSVRTTLDPQLQRKAREALREGLVRYDRKQGWRGTLTFEINQVKFSHVDPASNWGAKLAEIPLCGPSNPIPSGPVPRCVFSDLEPWRLGVVLSVDKDQAVVGLQPMRATGEVPAKVSVPYAEMKWARTAAKTAEKPKVPKIEGAHEILAPGQLIYVAPQSELGSEEASERKPGAPQTAAHDPNRNWRLMQIPKIEGAIVVMDPHTGRVLALVGGFSFAESQFDRAMQAKRQPGSSFKPIVYAAALDNGYTAVQRRARRAVSRSTRAGTQGAVEGQELRQQVRRRLHAAPRHREIAQPDDGAARAGSGHADRGGVCAALRRIRRAAACALHVARRRRNDAAAHDHGLLQLRQWRQEGARHADRPHSGPLRQDRLASRQRGSATIAPPSLERPGRAAN